MAYNIFNTVHRPLKLALLSTCIKLGRKNRFNKTEASNSLQKVEEVLIVFKEQIEFENCFVLPLIFEYEPSLCHNYLRQHGKQTDQLQKLERLLLAFREAKDEIEQFGVIIVIHEAFNEFLLTNYHHMDDEEEILNNVLWQYYGDDFLMKIKQEKQINVVTNEYRQQRTVLHSATAA